MVGAFGEQTVDERGVDAVGRKHRFGDALWRILVEIETGGAERQIEIGHDRIELEIVRDREADIVRDGRGADAALGADHRDDAADRLGVGRRKQPADRPYDLQHVDRRNQIIADAATHQLAVQHDVVRAPDDNDTRAGVAVIGELIEPGEDVVAAVFQFENDDVRRRRVLIGFDRRREPAHLNAQMRFGQTPIFTGRLNGGRGVDVLAEGLHRDARRRRDVFVAGGIGQVRLFAGGLVGLFHPIPALRMA